MNSLECILPRDGLGPLPSIITILAAETELKLPNELALSARLEQLFLSPTPQCHPRVCQLSMICTRVAETRVTENGLGTEQGLGLGGTPRPEEKGRICQNPTLGLSVDNPRAHSIVPVANSSMPPCSSCFAPPVSQPFALNFIIRASYSPASLSF